MSEKPPLIQGTGNVFRDLNMPDAGLKLVKAKLAAIILKSMDQQKLTVREAHSRTGVAAADFSRIRNADLSRFTFDRLFIIAGKLDSRVDISMKITRRRNAPVASGSNATRAGKGL